MKKLTAIVGTLVIILYAISAWAAVGDIITVAGGFTGDGGPATAAMTNAPRGVAVDSAGNIYIADTSNNRIRKVNASTGVITTVAGNGTAAYAGDNGPATAASLALPYGVAVDTVGNIYIADSWNNVIRKVNVSTGVITTVAGIYSTSGTFGGDNGPATSASLGYPMGVSVDAAGNIYIADEANDRIRKVNASTGVITTVAGNGIRGFSGNNGPATAASLNQPWGVAVDTAGNIYIADSWNGVIRKVTASTGVITTVAGTAGYFGSGGDNGPATSAYLYEPRDVYVDTAGNICIADSTNNSIRKVTASTGVITTVAGNGTAGFTGDNGAATSASLANPYGVSVDSAGNIYIADSGNNRIRKVTASTGVITTVGGNGIASFTGDNGAATAASLYRPAGVAVDSAGNIYIADSQNHRIREVNASTGVITTVAGNGTPGFAGDNGAATSASLYNPTGVSVDSSGNIFIADRANNRIRKVTASTGVITTVAGNGTAAYAGDNGPATAASLANPYGVSVDSAGNIYIADTSNVRIRKVTVSTGVITTVAGNGTYSFSGDNGLATSASLAGPYGVTVDSAGNIYIADSSNHRIRKVTASTGVITTVAGNGTQGFAGDNGAATSASLYYPYGVAVDAAGNIYIADNLNNCIRKVNTSTGVITTVAGNGTAGFTGDNGLATSASLAGPYGVTVDSAGNIFIADWASNRIRKVVMYDPPKVIATVAGNGTGAYAGDNGAATLASLYDPEVVAVDFAGNIYIADYGNNRIRKVNSATGVITTVAGNGGQGFSGDGGPATSASLHNPIGVAVDSAGNIFIADTYNQRIRKVNASTGVITTVAGNGIQGFSGDNGAATSASLGNPYGVSIDAAGNIYIADTLNGRIRKVNASTGVITTVAGNGATGFSGDNGVASSASLNGPVGLSADAAGNIYIVDQGNNRIREVTASTGVITTVAGNGTQGFSGDNGGATSASLNAPYGVIVDTAGNIYIADYGNQRIRKVIASTGVITTVAGNGVPGFSGDNGVATSASLNWPVGISVDAVGNIFIADFINNRIRKVYTPAFVPDTTPNPFTFTSQSNVALNAQFTSNTITVSGINAPTTISITGGQYSINSGAFTAAAGTVNNSDSVAVLLTSANAYSTPTSATLTIGGVNGTFSVTTLSATVPGAPTGVAATAGNGQASVYFTAPATNGGSAITSYTVTASPGGNTATGATSPITVSGLTNGTAYTFTVIAANAIGGSAASVASNSVTPATVPGAPTGVAATAGNGQATVTFTAPASNGGSAITSYTITASQGGLTATGASSPITVSGLTNGVAYTFTVTATNSSGTGAASTASNSVTISYVSAPGDIITAAGNGTAAYAGDNGPATSASIDGPAGVFVDSAGNIFIADQLSNRIRKVNAATGVITTVAGNGTAGFSGDNGPATAASLNIPASVFADAAGNIYIADNGNSCIRKVNASTGVITTVAGNGTAGFSGDNGPATSASLYAPYDISLDSAGNIYIADSENDRIRKVNTSTGVITTVAGNGTAGFSGDNGPATAASLNIPASVFVDAAENIYIADSRNNRIRKVNASTGAITTVAGNATSGFSGDNGPATAASLYLPYGVAVDTVGNIYIADSGNNRIRKVNTSTGVITTVAGNGTPGLSGDNGPGTAASLYVSIRVSVDDAGNIYIADYNNNRIRKVIAYDAPTGITTAAGNGTAAYAGDNGPATSGSLNYPQGVAVDSSGNIYIADNLNYRIRKVSGSTGVITTVTGIGTCSYSGDNGPAISAAQCGTNVAVDLSGNIYIADSNSRVRKVTVASGIITTIAGNGTYGNSGDNGPATSAKIAQPFGLAVDATGNIYITDFASHVVRKVNASMGIITTVAGNGVAGYSGDNGSATVAQLNGPIAVAVDSSGNIYIADYLNNVIRKVTVSTGVITTVAGNGTQGSLGDNGLATSASLYQPAGVALDSSGNIYISDEFSNRIRKVTVSTGIITTVAGNGTTGYSGDNGAATAAAINRPFGITVDSSGAIYIADFGNSRIRKVGATSAVNPTAPGAPTGVAAMAGNGQVLVSFTAPMSDGGSAITSYTVTASPGGITATGASSPVTVTGLTNGTAYTFTVTATNAAGTSTPSSASNSVTPVAPGSVSHSTPAVTGWTVSFTDQSSDPNGTTDAVMVNWGDGTVDNGVAGGVFTHTYSNLRARNYIISHMVIDPLNPRLLVVEKFSVNVPQRYTVSGLVTTSTGAPMGNAYVFLKQNGHTKQYKKTSSNGLFSFLNVLPGDYTVHVYKFGTTFGADTPIGSLSANQALTITATNP